MAGSVNKVTLIGNLGRDPEVRRMSSGDPVVNFSLATSDNWKDKTTGERKEKTEWHNIVIYNENLGRIAEQYLKKGSKVYLEGQLQSREYTDKEGQQRRITEIVLQRFRGELTLLDSRGQSAPVQDEDGGQSSRSGPADRRTPVAANGGSAARFGELDDDIPF